MRWTIVVAASALVLGVPGRAPAAGPREPALHPLRSTDPAAVQAGKRRAAVGAALASPIATLEAPARPKAVVLGPGSLNQPGLAASDNAARNDGTPPDPTGAVGPNHYVEFVNSVIRVYSKTDLSPVGSPVQTDDFVGATNDAVFDVQIQWDPQGNRWIYLADDCGLAAVPCTGTTALAYGFSRTADPTDLVNGWCKYTVRTDNNGGTGLFDDYPKLGHSDSQLIFGTNVFAGTAFVSARIWTVAKPSPAPITGACPPLTPHYWSGSASAPVRDGTLATAPLQAQDGSAIGTPIPADTTDSSANGYVVAAHDPVGTKIMAWHVDASGNLVADGDIGVSAFDVPAPVPQPATADVIDTADTRLTQAVAHADPDAGGTEAVWTQHTINGPDGRSVDRWYELLPATMTKRQEGNVSDPGNFVFNGAISPTMAGNEAVIQYNLGGPSQVAQIWASSRKSAQPLSATSTPVKIGDSTHVNQDFSCASIPPNPPGTACRWGDYAGATPDPAPPTGQPDGPEHRVWGTNQLIGDPRPATPTDPNPPHWITRNFAVVPEHVAPTASFTVSPATATRTVAVTFDGSGSSDTELPGGIATYAWDFDGDGTPDQTTTAPTVTHIYTALGSYSPRLVVTDVDDGLASAAATQPIAIQNIPPIAKLTSTPTPAVDGSPTTFRASGSSDPDGSIASYRWDLDGNGSFETNTRTRATVTRRFTTLGGHVVRLRVTDSDGATSSTTRTIRVVRPRLKLVLSFGKSVKLTRLLASGLSGKATCGRTCTLTLELTVPRTVARRLQTTTTIGSGSVRVGGTATKTVELSLSRSARAALERAGPRTLTLTVRGTAKAPSGARSSAKQTIKATR